MGTRPHSPLGQQPSVPREKMWTVWVCDLGLVEFLDTSTLPAFRWVSTTRLYLQRSAVFQPEHRAGLGAGQHPPARSFPQHGSLDGQVVCRQHARTCAQSSLSCTGMHRCQRCSYSKMNADCWRQQSKHSELSWSCSRQMLASISLRMQLCRGLLRPINRQSCDF